MLKKKLIQIYGLQLHTKISYLQDQIQIYLQKNPSTLYDKTNFNKTLLVLLINICINRNFVILQTLILQLSK